MTEPYSFGPIPDQNDPSKIILHFKQGDVTHEKDITGIALPSDQQERFDFLHRMIYEEGWVPSNNATLVIV